MCPDHGIGLATFTGCLNSISVHLATRNQHLEAHIHNRRHNNENEDRERVGKQQESKIMQERATQISSMLSTLLP